MIIEQRDIARLTDEEMAELIAGIRELATIDHSGVHTLYAAFAEALEEASRQREWAFARLELDTLGEPE